MPLNRSTKDFTLSSNERLYLNKNNNSLFVFEKVKNFTSDLVTFYTFSAGFKKKSNDLLIALFKYSSAVAAVYSKTSTPSAPIIWDKKNNKGLCKLLIVNSGNANAHTGKEGIKSIDKYTSKAENIFNCKKKEILVSSTGVIGEPLKSEQISKVYSSVLKSKKKDLLSAAKTIMTTDTYPKMILRKIKIKNKTIKIFGFAKGSGMIFPNMGTMLAYIFIEANISKLYLKKLLFSHLDTSFNSISVDGDTSTSDTVMLFSLSNEDEKKINDLKSLNKISNTLKNVMSNLALQIVSDGEGISKLIEVNVTGSKSYVQASSVAFSIANSPLVKTAIAGEDANWGRIIMAIGKADLNIDQNKIKLKFGKYIIAQNGRGYKKTNTKKIDKYMKNKKIEINVNLGIGTSKRTVYSSDLTYNYIKINADYRS